jgi:hypothetical protein
MQRAAPLTYIHPNCRRSRAGPVAPAAAPPPAPLQSPESDETTLQVYPSIPNTSQLRNSGVTLAGNILTLAHGADMPMVDDFLEKEVLLDHPVPGIFEVSLRVEDGWQVAGLADDFGR